LLATALAVVAGSLLVKEVEPFPLIVAVASATLVAAGGYAVNDYFDIEIDRINKPQRPIPSGRVGAREAYLLSTFLLAAGALVAFSVGLATGLFATLNAFLMYYYSKWIKRTGLLGNIVVSFSTASTILYGALAELEWAGSLHQLWTTVPVFAMVFLMTLSREIVKGVEDFVGDSKAGVRTVAVIKGPRTALKVSLLLLALSIGCGYIAAWSVGLGALFVASITVGGAISLLALFKCASSPDPVACASKPRRLMKVAMFLGLVGIIADRALPHVLYIQPRRE